ncbi:MAG: cob(I)yrinic acid a,c-diamide adenosyltransferase [bacterium]|nr:cob(I)yrinic acid a,c-diamide adenosyltransferase [bacterium]
MRVYTRSGDQGQTGAIGGRLAKDHPRIEAYGTVDEVNSLIGMTMSCLEEERDADLLADLAEIQQNLFDCCSDLATLKPELREYRITEAHVEGLEAHIDRYNAQSRDIEYFIIPGGARCSALLHLCRTTTRRAERRVITLERDAEPVNPLVKKYLNRLSDLFFVMARVGNMRENVPDIYYTRSKKVFRSGKKTTKGQ